LASDLRYKYSERKRKERKMRKIILASHGELANGMKMSVEMIAGEQDNLYAVSMCGTMGPQDVLQKVKEILAEDETCQAILITDLSGGSVNTALSELLREERCSLVSGMNIMLVLDIVMSDESSNIDEILESALRDAKKTILNVGEMLNSQEEEGEMFYD